MTRFVMAVHILLEVINTIILVFDWVLSICFGQVITTLRCVGLTLPSAWVTRDKSGLIQGTDTLSFVMFGDVEHKSM